VGAEQEQKPRFERNLNICSSENSNIGGFHCLLDRVCGVWRIELVTYLDLLSISKRSTRTLGVSDLLSISNSTSHIPPMGRGGGAETPRVRAAIPPFA